ncbi:hypothetical protein [Tritonibacter mobilis]|uniref:hypothetical protein n=1 Tax=Tritonibacter mobilis TaxID=379347 RepID=UPI00398F9164
MHGDSWLNMNVKIEFKLHEPDPQKEVKEKAFRYLPALPLMLNLLPYFLCFYFERERLSDLWNADRPIMLGFNLFVLLLFVASVILYYYYYFSRRAEAMIVGSLLFSTIPMHLMALGVSVFVLQSFIFVSITICAILFALSNFQRANKAIDSEALEKYAREVIVSENGTVKYYHGIDFEGSLLAVKAVGKGRYAMECALAIPMILLMLVVWPVVFTDDNFPNNVPVSTLFWFMFVVFGVVLRGIGLSQAWLLHRVLRLVRSPDWKLELHRRDQNVGASAH